MGYKITVFCSIIAAESAFPNSFKLYTYRLKFQFFFAILYQFFELFACLNFSIKIITVANAICIMSTPYYVILVRVKKARSCAGGAGVITTLDWEMFQKSIRRNAPVLRFSKFS